MMDLYEPSIYKHPLGPSKEEKEEARRRADERSLAPYEKKTEKLERRGKASGGARGGGGGGGMMPDTEKVPGKRPLKMAKGGSVKSSASKRGDGCAIRGKTRGKMV